MEKPSATHYHYAGILPIVIVFLALVWAVLAYAEFSSKKTAGQAPQKPPKAKTKHAGSTA